MPICKTARYLQRRAQFYLDFVEAENSTGFHAPQEAARILGESLNYARQGQIAVRDASFKPTVAIVDIPPPPAPAPARGSGAGDALTLTTSSAGRATVRRCRQTLRSDGTVTLGGASG